MFREKLLSFVKAGLTLAEMRGKSYLAIGSVSMGIAGSMINEDFFEDYLGMRCEQVDMSEIKRRIEENIYDKEEFKHAMQWVETFCEEGIDPNPSDKQFNRKKKDEVWEMVVKMTLIFRDLMVGNPALKAIGYEEESLGHNAIVSGFQGQRQWTDHFPER